LWVWITMRSQEGNVRDSAFEVSYQVLEQYSEQINHQKEMSNGRYVLGSNPAEIFYADGGQLVLPSSVTEKMAELPRKKQLEYLPLARKDVGLHRPMFQTTHLVLAAGVCMADFSGLQAIAQSPSNTYVPIEFSLEVPFGLSSPLSFIGGWGFAVGGAGGGSLTQLTALFQYRSLSSSSFSPIIGIGAREAWYSRDMDSLIVSSTVVSPIIVLGAVLVRNQIDFVLEIPLRTEVSTIFEGKSYSFKPTGARLILQISLR
jgi:hypothetical protein